MSDDTARIEAKLDTLTKSLNAVLDRLGPSITALEVGKGFLASRFGIGEDLRGELSASETELSAAQEVIERVQAENEKLQVALKKRNVELEQAAQTINKLMDQKEVKHAKNEAPRGSRTITAGRVVSES